MSKLKLYLDTTIISHLYALDAPEKMQETLLFWEDVKAEKYEIVLSEVVFEEIGKCYQPKQQMMLGYVAEIEYSEVEVDKTITDIADEIIRMGILNEPQRDDCRHIGCAVVSQCDYIVSWNFKHLVNVKTVEGVRKVTNLLHYKPIDIITPKTLIKKEDKSCQS